MPAASGERGLAEHVIGSSAKAEGSVSLPAHGGCFGSHLCNDSSGRARLPAHNWNGDGMSLILTL